MGKFTDLEDQKVHQQLKIISNYDKLLEVEEKLGRAEVEDE